MNLLSVVCSNALKGLAMHKVLPDYAGVEGEGAYMYAALSLSFSKEAFPTPRSRDIKVTNRETLMFPHLEPSVSKYTLL